MNFKYIIIVASLLLLSCSNSKSCDENTIDIEPKEQELQLSKIFSSHETLEFKGKLLGSVIDLIKVDGGYILHSVGSKSELDFFDNNGTFISSIIEVGRARNEVINIVDLYYDQEQKQLEILADYGMNVRIYSLTERAVVDRFDLPQSICIAKAISKLDENRYVFYKNLGYDESEDFKIFVYNRQSESVEHKYLPFNSKHVENISFSQSNNLYKKGDDVIFYEAFLDKGYRIAQNSISDYFIFDKKGLAVPQQKLNVEYHDVSEFVDICEQNKYIFAHIDCYEYKDMLFSRYKYNDKSYINVANLKKLSSESYTAINDDFITNEVVDTFGYYIVEADQHGLYLVVDPGKFEAFDSLDSSSTAVVVLK